MLTVRKLGGLLLHILEMEFTEKSRIGNALQAKPEKMDTLVGSSCTLHSRSIRTKD